MFAESSFREAFAAANSVESMTRHCEASFGAAIQAAEIANPRVRTLLIDHDDELAGFAQLRFSPPPPCVRAQGAGEIQRFYVSSRWHGQGLAQRLMAACIDGVRAQGGDAVWLGVWEHNPRAITFYRKCGFEAVGEHTFFLGEERQRDIVMLRSLDGNASTPGVE